MFKLTQNLKYSIGLIILMFILSSPGCKKDDFRTKYYGEYRFTVHVQYQSFLYYIDSTYIINGGVRAGSSSRGILINWQEGAYGSYPSLSEDGTFIGDNCKGEFKDVNTVIFSVSYHHTSTDTYYNVTGTRN